MPVAPSPPGDIAGACLRQWTAVTAAVDLLPDDAFAAPSRLPHWRVAELVAHLAACQLAVVGWLSQPAPPRAELTAASYLLYLPTVAALVEAREIDAAKDATPANLRLGVRAALDAMTAAISAAPPGRIVAARAGAIRLDELLITRCVEGVVHLLDLDRGHQPDREALKISTKALLGAMAIKAPGKSVEVRVPPFGAVQAVEGIRHTRGTPPNVVETDAVTWIELATGRLSWTLAIESTAVRASGDRSNISEFLPLL